MDFPYIHSQNLVVRFLWFNEDLELTASKTGEYKDQHH